MGNIGSRHYLEWDFAVDATQRLNTHLAKKAKGIIDLGNLTNKKILQALFTNNYRVHLLLSNIYSKAFYLVKAHLIKSY